MLTTNIDKTTVQLKWSNKKNTEIYGIHPGLGEEIPSSYGGGGFSMGLMSVVPNGHYLFAIAGKPHAKVVVEVTFPGGPSEPTPVEIIVTESAEATDLL